MTTPTIQELLPPPCCCREPVDDCEDCEVETASTCFRVRHESWGTEVESLWGIPQSRSPHTTPQFNIRCGSLAIVDQYDCDARRWRVEELPPFCEDDPNADGTYLIPEAGAPLFLGWVVDGSCSLVKLGLWVGSGFNRLISGQTLGTFQRIEQIDTADLWNEGVSGIQTRAPDETIYASPFWSKNEFQLGEWLFERAACVTPVSGPNCLRVTATGVDAYCDIPVPDDSSSACTAGGFSYCERSQNSFAGELRNALDTARVSWFINRDKTEITLTVGTDSATFAYTSDWWTTGRLVGDYTVGPCVTDCDWETSCWPDLCPCLVDGSEDPPVLYRTIYADVSGDHTETELPLAPDDALGRYQWTRGGSDAITILCMNGGADPYMVSVSLGPDSYFCTIPANGLQCDGGQLVDEIITCGDITIRLYTL